MVAVKAAFGALISGNSIMEAVNQSRKLLEVTRDLEDSQRAFNIQAQRTNNEIANLIIGSKNRAKSDEERLRMIAKANELEADIHRQSVERVKRLLAEEMAAFQQKTKLTDLEMKVLTTQTTTFAKELRERVESVKAYSEDELDAIQEKLSEVAKLEGESAALRERLANRADQLQQDMAKEAEAVAAKQAEAANRLAEAKAKALEKERADAEANAAKMRQIADDFTKERMDDLDRRTLEAGQRAVELREAGVAEVEIQRFLSDELVAINREEQTAILDGKLAALDAMAIKAKDKINREIEDEHARAAALLAIDIDLMEARGYVIDQGITDYAASLAELGVLDAERSAQLLLDKATVDAQLVDLERQKSDMLIAEADRVAQAQKEAQDTYMSAAQGTLGVVGDIIGGYQQALENNIKAIEEQAKAAGRTDAEISRMTRSARKEAHDAAVAAATVQMFMAALAAYASGSAVPIAGVALGPIAAAAALAFGAYNVAQVSMQKYEDGGVLQGPTHAHGGIPVTVDGRAGYEAEGGEIVLTKGVFADPHLRQIASQLNVAGGGVPIVERSGMFAVGGALGGSSTFAARSASAQSAMTREQMTMAMNDAMRNMPAPIVKVSDINRVSGDAARVSVMADLR